MPPHGRQCQYLDGHSYGVTFRVRPVAFDNKFIPPFVSCIKAEGRGEKLRFVEPDFRARKRSVVKITWPDGGSPCNISAA